MLAKRGDALNLAGEVGVVNTSPVPVVKGQVIGGRWEVEEFRYGLYTMLPDGSQALSGSPAWVEASMPIELDEAGAAAYSGNGVRLLGAGADVSYCPEDGSSEERWRNEMLPPASAVGVHAVDIVGAKAAIEQAAAARPPALTLLHNLLLPASAEAAVLDGCSAADHWPELEDALLARVRAALKESAPQLFRGDGPELQGALVSQVRSNALCPSCQLTPWSLCAVCAGGGAAHYAGWGRCCGARPGAAVANAWPGPAGLPVPRTQPQRLGAIQIRCCRVCLPQSC